jgi:hypothetical protein
MDETLLRSLRTKGSVPGNAWRQTYPHSLCRPDFPSEKQIPNLETLELESRGRDSLLLVGLESEKMKSALKPRKIAFKT